jgi:hypothetical protein
VATVGPSSELVAAEGEIKQALESGSAREATALPPHLRHLSERGQAQELELKRLFAQQEYDLRRTYARGILWLLGVEMLIANVVFVAFAWAGEHWKLETAVVDVWLGATAVQVVGIVLVVTRHLFPDRDDKPSSKP